MEIEKYEIIYADPAWKQSKGGKKSVRKNSSGMKLDYDVMDFENIRQTLLWFFNNKTTKDHCIFIWTIDKYLTDTDLMMVEFGYKRHARFIWDKVTGIPAAFTVRYSHEYLLWYYKSKLLPIEKSERGKFSTVMREKVIKHSKKPELAYQMIERLYPNFRKLELFARERRLGWDSWGNEV